MVSRLISLNVDEWGARPLVTDWLQLRESWPSLRPAPGKIDSTTAGTTTEARTRQCSVAEWSVATSTTEKGAKEHRFPEVARMGKQNMHMSVTYGSSLRTRNACFHTQGKTTSERNMCL